MWKRCWELCLRSEFSRIELLESRAKDGTPGLIVLEQVLRGQIISIGVYTAASAWLLIRTI